MSAESFSGRKVVLEGLDHGNPEHVLFVYEARRHPDVTKWLLGNPPASLDSHMEWLKRNVPSNRLMYVARSLEGGKLVGYCHVTPGGDWVELGFVIHPDFQGLHYGSSMVSELLEEAGRKFPGRRVFLEVKVENERALRLYERHGFVRKMVRMELPR